jgi:hypothetical protein
MSKDKSYDETHFQGRISFEQDVKMGVKEGDIGVQISRDGKIWICIDGQALIRFMPKSRYTSKQEGTLYECPECDFTDIYTAPDLSEIGDPCCPQCLVDRDKEVQMEVM